MSSCAFVKKKMHLQCKKSFNDIKSFVLAKATLNNEDLKLTKLMESVIPKHLAGRMRDDIINNYSQGQLKLKKSQNKGIGETGSGSDDDNIAKCLQAQSVFQKIYLDSYDDVR